MLDKLVFALEVGKGQLTDLDTLAILSRVGPLNALKLQEKVEDENGVDEVDECVAHIALSLWVMKKNQRLPLDPLEDRSSRTYLCGFL